LADRLLRTKPVEPLVAETAGDPKHGHLNRSFGLFQLTMLGVGATIGTGIFIIMNEAAPVAGPSVVLSLLCRKHGVPLRLVTLVVRDKQMYPSGIGYNVEQVVANQWRAQAVEAQQSILPDLPGELRVETTSAMARTGRPR
jgi:hypothetical protein